MYNSGAEIVATQQRIDALIDAARDKKTVSGLTHNFYRYPARFSPQFVRAAIEAFTAPGDWVLDPFAGGGTTLVEALAAGRHAFGADISELSAFVCEAKTLVLDDKEATAVKRWITRIPDTINMHASGMRFEHYADAGYYRNIVGTEYWRLRKAIEQALASVERLRLSRAKTLTRCAVLRTAQWALDGRKTLPSVAQFKETLITQAKSMLKAALEFRSRVKQGRPNALHAISINSSASELNKAPEIKRVGKPKLVLTSPPYPGIHVLYHRWQVDGRKETPAPFWIANKLDGSGATYYTMGNRQQPGLASYFDNLEASFRSIAAIAGPDTVIVQMVAFSEPEWQLNRYLEVMEECGLREVQPWTLNDEADGRLWRTVPNRKWHAQQKKRANGAREVVLIHKRSCT